MSFDIFDQFATDDTLEINGVTVPVGTDSTLKIAREGNTKYNKLRNKLIEQNSVLLQSGGDAADKAANDLVIDTMAETILVGWENLQYKGQDYGPYSVEKAKVLLKHKDFREFVGSRSRQLEAYKAKREAEDTKN